MGDASAFWSPTAQHGRHTVVVTLHSPSPFHVSKRLLPPPKSHSNFALTVCSSIPLLSGWNSASLASDIRLCFNCVLCTACNFISYRFSIICWSFCLVMPCAFRCYSTTLHWHSSHAKIPVLQIPKGSGYPWLQYAIKSTATQCQAHRWMNEQRLLEDTWTTHIDCHSLSLVTGSWATN